MAQNSIEILLKTKKTIFTTKELAYLWQISNPDTLKSKVYFLVKNKKLIALHKGIYALDNNFNKFELAGKLKPPSYISGETVLYQESLIFQYSTDIASISNAAKTIKCQNTDYVYHKIKDEILFNQKGLKILDNYYQAEKERAFLDTIYLNKNYYFDNLSSLDWQKCFSLADIYKNKALKKRVKNYYNTYAKQNST